MTQQNEYYAYFTLTGKFDPDEITARIALTPTDSWKKGDRNEKTYLERKFSRWSLYSRPTRDVSLERHVNDVLEQLEAQKPAVQALQREFRGWIQVVAYLHRDYPGLSFELPTISRLAALGLGMDFDFYYLYSDKREDS